jgi:two-component sensor histidine kinase
MREDPTGWASLRDIRATVRAVFSLAMAVSLGLAFLEVVARAGRIWPLAGMLAVLAAVWVMIEWLLGQWLARLQTLSAARIEGPPPGQADRAPQEVRPLALKLHAMTERLRRQETELLEASAEKDILVREIHHRVRNNLQVLASLVNMQRRTLTDTSADAALADLRDRIAALSLIHRTLYQGPDLRHVDVGRFLDELIKDQIADQQGPEPRLRARVEAEPLTIESEQLASFALFAVEAISNVRKHALTDGQGGFLVRVATRNGEAELLIADEGSGAPPDLSRDGRGKTLMAGFARQLRGRLAITANDAGGVSVRLTFPIDDVTPSPGGRAAVAGT